MRVDYTTHRRLSLRNGTGDESLHLLTPRRFTTHPTSTQSVHNRVMATANAPFHSVITPCKRSTSSDGEGKLSALVGDLVRACVVDGVVVLAVVTANVVVTTVLVVSVYVTVLDEVVVVDDVDVVVIQGLGVHPGVPDDVHSS